MSSQLWDRYAVVGYDALGRVIPYREMLHALLEAAALAPGKRLLVAGCGTGAFENLATREISGLEVDAVDFSEGMLACAKAKCADRPEIRYMQADLCAPLPFPDESFDAVVMCNVLYALPDPPAALREIHRVLKPQGRFVLCDRYPSSSIAKVSSRHFAALGRLPWKARIAGWWEFLTTIPATIGIVISTMAIWKEHYAGKYHLYTEDEIHAKLTEMGFVPQSLIKAYADQCWLIRSHRSSEGCSAP